MPLSNATILAAKPKDKPYKLYDQDGLYVLVAPSGGKLWRMRYNFLRKEKLLAIRSYPEISLKDARQKQTPILSIAL